MRSHQEDPPGGYTRHETESQRLDRNFNELLQELRVAQAGVQILFGFLLSLAFQARFETLDQFQLDVYIVTLIAAALAVVFFTGPVAAHRLLFRRGVKDFLVRYTARLAGIGLVFLAAAVVGGVELVIDVLLSRGASLGVGGGLVLVGILLWIVLPLRVRDFGRDPER
jgi:hypothetical protein